MKNAFVVYKYELPQGGEVELTGRFNRFLKAGEQNGKLVLWTENLLDESEPTDTVSFLVIGTGWKYIKTISGSHLSYVDTVQMSDGLVWHIFVRIPDGSLV